jgi:hypothetical protein
MSGYIYSALPAGRDGFRILRLRPGNADDGVVCDLTSARLGSSELASYDALSYCWGDPNDRITITIDGRELHVTRNLHAALRKLRSVSECRLLWADAVCINQEDAEEKGQQVQLMRDIYRKAERTIVWLGEGSRFTPLGFNLIPRLPNAHRLRIDREDDRPLHYLSAADRDSYDLPSHLSQDWLGLVCIFDLPYFKRIWIVQEVAASRRVEIFCGNDSCSWDELVNSLHACHGLQLSRLYDMSMTPPIHVIDRAKVSVHHGLRWSLLELLVRYRSFNATDKRDKIFALLGLVDSENLSSTSITPNYDRGHTAEMAYTSLARTLLEKSNHLDILSAPQPISSPERRMQLPSWVPDWSLQPQVESLLNFAIPDMTRMAAEGIELPADEPDNEEPRAKLPVLFAATGSSQSTPKFDATKTLLGVEGYVLDEVDRVGMTVNNPYAGVSHSDLINSKSLLSMLAALPRLIFGAAEMSRAWMDWEAITAARTRQHYVTGEPMLDAYWKTFLGGHMACSEDRWPDERNRWETLVRDYRTPARFNLHKSPAAYAVALGAMAGALIVRQWVGTAVDVPPSSELPAELESPSGEMILGRRMFTTRDGFIGLGPQALQTGDCIALCKGGKVPYVLRKVPVGYELIGECYVHGIMQGERFEVQNCGEIWIA